ncbi:tautomerase family protein [Serratia sp. M24T3]|uniref:tautomerase family protein n=1 Tax=Serratia sp. M24T3 TaxID=932213 RepID=UPI00025B9916|nr:tautomerase family protein [Serratia sp. M24T3]EIC83812.1 hypothetical Protein SPM24T3_14681 [Serratia sp. M24T3]
MPMTRIAIPEQRFTLWRDAISRALQQTLVSSFDIPETDCFQLFDRYQPEERIFDRHYLSGSEQGRSEDFLLFQITAGRPRGPEEKQKLYLKLVELLGQSIGIKPQDVMVVITFTQPEDWSFGSGKLFKVSDIPRP